MRITLFAGGIAGAALFALAAPAAAVEPVHIDSIGIYSPGQTVVTTGGNSVTDYAAAIRLTGTHDGRPFDALGFCVDLYHNISVGFGSQLAVNLNYHVAPLTTDANGLPLSSAQIRQIGGLATLGFGIAGDGLGDKAERLAAIQQAIWTIEYPASTFAAAGGFAAAQAGYVAQYLALAPTLKGFARTIYADNFATQGFITSVGGVPEPGVWVQLIAGFAAVGVLARRRRVALAV